MTRAAGTRLGSRQIVPSPGAGAVGRTGPAAATGPTRDAATCGVVPAFAPDRPALLRLEGEALPEAAN